MRHESSTELATLSTLSSAWTSSTSDLPQVVIFWDGGSSQHDLAPGTTLVVGRSRDCDVRVPEVLLSRRHLAVHAGPPLAIEDLGGVNGTRLWGRRVPPGSKVVLERGGLIELGPVVVVVRAPQADESAPPANDKMPLGRLVHLVASSDLNIILFGETGAGKEIAAERIVRLSSRAGGPFVRINCAALPEALLESELFGHERGAFTGAVRTKPGLLEAATGGTLLLDEIGEMPPAMQAKLLRVIERREVLRIGALEPRPIDVRILAATHCDLRESIEHGTFRRDLYFRLNGMTIAIPPLRERRGEIASLAEHFAAAASARASRPTPALSREALDLLESHSWPGNVRELKNVIERAVVLGGDGATLRREHVLIDEPRPSSASVPFESGLDVGVQSYERACILDALERSGGNQTVAAGQLGISRRKLVGRLTAYGLTKRTRRSG